MDTKINTMSDFLGQDLVKNKINDMLKGKAAQFITSIISLVGNDEKLRTVDKVSLLNACLTAASLDLPVNPNLGLAYIIPYNNKAQLQLGYKAYIQLAQRSGQFQTIDAKPIYEGQLEEDDSFLGIKFNWKNKKNDNLIGYASYFKLLNGFEKTLFSTVDDLKKHGKKYSQTYKKGYGLWEENFEAMASKTVLKFLLSKYAPLSIEMQTAIQADQAVITDTGYEYIDNRTITAEEQSKTIERKRIEDHINNSQTLDELEMGIDYINALDDSDTLKEAYTNKKDLLNKQIN